MNALGHLLADVLVATAYMVWPLLVTVALFAGAAPNRPLD